MSQQRFQMPILLYLLYHAGYLSDITQIFPGIYDGVNDPGKIVKHLI